MPPPPPHAYKFKYSFSSNNPIMGGPPIIPYYDVTFSFHGLLVYFPPLYSSCNLDLLNLDHYKCCCVLKWVFPHP